ncbi:RING/U-box superfamily protein with ARM repeat domain-containing protein [Actinidia rufa]|uniref:RING-type E3 ubiquitin transferase n=1 Tax=Actinidia rufa TaxID=165716 RepID=A0A7J0GMM1_9ERIC|nr:RING/U-box superfamily protein with ARM repeat domain-containing protein [Actinidia rufa]
MGGNGKHRWKISIYRSSSSKKLEKKEPPSEFICPISGSLMSDPVVVSSGQTFERTSVQWCDASGADCPTAPDYGAVEDVVRTFVGDGGLKIRASERELLRGVAEKPAVLFSHAATELNPRVNHFDSASSEESVIANVPTTPLLPFATRPMCYSAESSSSIASDEEGINPNFSSEDEEFVVKLKSSDVFEQEQSVIALRKITRSNEEARVSLCTPRLLSSLRPLLISRYAVVQTNAIAAVVNLSLEKVNKVKIVRSGIAPPLIDVLKGGAAESQEHAAGAIFSLALEDDNRMAMGVLGALQPLLHALRSESNRTRHDSAMALYHLSLVQSNRVKLVKLGAVSTLLSMLRGGELAGRVMLVLCNLAACNEGRSAMLDANAVEILGGGVAAVLREVEERGSERAREKARKMLLLLRGRDEAAAAAEEAVFEGGPSRARHRVGRNSNGPNSTEF